MTDNWEALERHGLPDSDGRNQANNKHSGQTPVTHDLNTTQTPHSSCVLMEPVKPVLMNRMLIDTVYHHINTLGYITLGRCKAKGKQWRFQNNHVVKKSLTHQNKARFLKVVAMEFLRYSALFKRAMFLWYVGFQVQFELLHVKE